MPLVSVGHVGHVDSECGACGQCFAFGWGRGAIWTCPVTTQGEGSPQLASQENPGPSI